MARSVHRFGLLVSLATLVAACDGGGTSSTTEGGGGRGGDTTTSSTTSTGGGGTGGAPTGGGGTGGAPTGGGGTGGAPTGGGGTGGAPTGGGGMGGTGGAPTGGGGMGGTGGGTGGTGGMMMPTEICGNMMDDDGDMDADCADADCAGAPACGTLVINEVDYDNPMTDTAEFVEIFNAGMTDVDLDTLTLAIVNGNDSSVLHEVPLSGTLPAGGYLVVAGPGVMNVDPAAMVLPLPLAESNLQNGGVPQGDGVAIYDTVNDVVHDALSYEGSVTAAMIGGGMFNLVAGNPTLAYDDGYPGKSLIRYPNGQDTGDDATDWTGTLTHTPGAANVASEVCDDLLDNDGDMLVDCADPSCNDTPECPEVCTNGVDDDGDMLADCADMFCDNMACNMFGSTCMGGMCVCPGGNVEMACAGGMDEDCDGMVDCADTDCAATPACTTQIVSSVDFPVITHGGQLVISGSGFTGSTMVTIGGMSVPFVVDSNNQITIASMPDGVPLGVQSIVVTTPAGDTAPYDVTVIHLLINEVDADTAGTDAAELVEIATGVPGVSLAGYTLVFWNGSNDQSYLALSLNGTTDAAGLLLTGNSGLMPSPSAMCTWPNNTLQNGQDAVSVHQAPPASFPNNTAVTAANIIDAVVYETADADDAGLLDVLIGPAGSPGYVQADEGMAGAGSPAEMQSVQRCGDGRRRGDKFVAGAPSPGVANTVAACP